MKLSEAILLGIGFVKENKAVFLVSKPDLCGCAIGTALAAVNKIQNGWVIDGIKACWKEWPWTKEYSPDYPESDITIAHVISSRHVKGESRESLAKWIATIEPQDEVVNGQDMLRLPQADEAGRSVTNHA